MSKNDACHGFSLRFSDREGFSQHWSHKGDHWLDAKFLAKALPGSHRFRSCGEPHSITTYHNSVLGKEVARFKKVELRKLPWGEQWKKIEVVNPTVDSTRRGLHLHLQSYKNTKKTCIFYIYHHHDYDRYNILYGCVHPFLDASGVSSSI